MSSSKIVRTRKSGWCSSEFAHPAKINVGDRVLVVTTFPQEWPNCDYDRPRFARYRVCSWCLADEEEHGWRIHPQPTATTADHMNRSDHA